MKNLLKLHEAVAIVLLEKKTKTATFEEIAAEVDNRGIFPKRKGRISLAKQIELRTAISSSRYKHLFEFKKPNILSLK